MRKVSLLLVIFLLLVAGSVEAQKRGGRTRPIPVPGTYSLQDDEGGGFLAFDAATGQFKCFMCEYGYAMSGVGKVSYDGLTVTFNAVTDQYKVFVSINVYERVA